MGKIETVNAADSLWIKNHHRALQLLQITRYAQVKLVPCEKEFLPLSIRLCYIFHLFPAVHSLLQ